MQLKDSYKILGIKETATDEEVMSAYRRLAKKYHPDMYLMNMEKALASTRFVAIDSAYKKIISANKEVEEKSILNALGAVLSRT